MVSALGGSNIEPYGRAGLFRPATGQTDSALPGQRTAKSREEKAESPADATAPRAANGKPLSEEGQETVRRLQKRDREVRQHEQAHLAAGGAYASGPYYEYENGPDGKRYVVGGSVNIDTSGIPGDPAATARKLETVIRAALAPADPSGQDLAVAAAARQGKLEAQNQLAEERKAAFTERQSGGGGRSGRRGSLLDISV
jgi:hypothetical protein